MTIQTHRGVPAPLSREDMTVDRLALLRDNRSLQALWRAWKDQFDAAGGQVPDKQKLRMQAVKTILPLLIISEREMDNTIRIRLAGSLVDELLGGGLTGANTLDLSPPDQRPAIQRVYHNIAGQPCGFYISELLSLVDGKVSHLDALLLPLAGNGGTVQYFVGVYHFGEHGYEFGRTELARVEHRKVERFGYLDLGFGLPE